MPDLTLPIGVRDRLLVYPYLLVDAGHLVMDHQRHFYRYHHRLAICLPGAAGRLESDPGDFFAVQRVVTPNIIHERQLVFHRERTKRPLGDIVVVEVGFLAVYRQTGALVAEMIVELVFHRVIIIFVGTGIKMNWSFIERGAAIEAHVVFVNDIRLKPFRVLVIGHGAGTVTEGEPHLFYQRAAAVEPQVNTAGFGAAGIVRDEHFRDRRPGALAAIGENELYPELPGPVFDQVRLRKINIGAVKIPVRTLQRRAWRQLPELRAVTGIKIRHAETASGQRSFHV